jgi:hypothetical protein
MTSNMQATLAWLREQGAMCNTCDDCKRNAIEVSILSIDAWRDGPGWTWNNWSRVGRITVGELNTLKTSREILSYMRREGYLSDRSAGRVAIDDDQYNLVICERGNMMPVFAIAYGEAQ